MRAAAVREHTGGFQIEERRSLEPGPAQVLVEVAGTRIFS